MQVRLNLHKGSQTGDSDVSLPGKVAAAIAGIVVVVFVGLLFTRFAHRDFIGKQTRLIHECKINPKSNPEVCSELLAARRPDRNAGGSAFRDPTLHKGFQLTADDEPNQRFGALRR